MFAQPGTQEGKRFFFVFFCFFDVHAPVRQGARRTRDNNATARSQRATPQRCRPKSRDTNVGFIDVHLEGHTASVAAAVGAADAGGVNGVVVGAARVVAAAVLCIAAAPIRDFARGGFLAVVAAWHWCMQRCPGLSTVL